MRILMLSWEYPPRIVGGIARVVHDLAQKLVEQGNEVHVITYLEQGTESFELDKNIYVHRVKATEISAYNFINWVMQLNFELIERANIVIKETGDFDIIHAHDWVVAFAAKILKHSYSIPLISTIHATEHGRNQGLHDDSQRYISSVEWLLTYESWKVIVNSQYMKHEVISIFALPEDKINMINNGVDINKFKGIKKDIAFRRKFASDQEKIVLFVGRLVNQKGAHVLIDSIPKVLQDYRDAKFVIVGRGPELEYLKSKADQLGVSTKIYFTGYVEDSDLMKLYKCSDIGIFPSLYEPFGIVALEAMLAEIPVIVSDTGGLSDIIQHGVDGLKAYAGNANSLADNILYLLYNSNDAKAIAKEAYKKVNSIYNWDTISCDTINVYMHVINEAVATQWSARKKGEQH